jgi:kojibiose phosphorylase
MRAEADTLHESTAAAFPEPTDDPAWLLCCEGFDALREHEVETWLTVANGRVGSRGALEEGSPHSAPMTLVAGAYGDAKGDPLIREPLPAPEWHSVALRVDGSRLDIESGEIVEHRRILDMFQGVVLREWLHRDRAGRLVRVRTVRFASLDDRAIVALRAEARMAEAEAAELRWEDSPGYIAPPDGATLEIDALRLEDGGLLTHTWGRNGGSHAVALATYATPGSRIARQQFQVGIGGHLADGEAASVDRLGAVAISVSHDSCGTPAKTALERARALGFDELLRRHRAAWAASWRQCDLRIDGDPEAQRAARFSVYHMVGSADPETSSVSVGARGLSGMSYLMHVFWDTEIFVVPFFIYSFPETARTLLTYRYTNLDGARAKARHLGFAGTLFPWESADGGAETTPEFVTGPDGKTGRTPFTDPLATLVP